MKQTNLVIKLTGVSKIYQLHLEKPTLVENILRRHKNETFMALRNINLEIKKGEKIGIVGSNGSGKTTLLKIISGIATPNKGRLQIWGKLVSLIDLSAGFHPELTGIENIYLNALLLGMDRREIASRLDEIVRFADIGKFIDAPLYTYSQGMQLRLGFSIAIATDPDILILDEAVSVGDEDFQIKSGRKIEEFYRQKKTIIVASHWLGFLQEHCERILWIDEGKVKRDGKTEIILNEYSKKFDHETA